MNFFFWRGGVACTKQFITSPSLSLSLGLDLSQMADKSTSVSLVISVYIWPSGFMYLQHSPQKHGAFSLEGFNILPPAVLFGNFKGFLMQTNADLVAEGCPETTSHSLLYGPFYAYIKFSPFQKLFFNSITQILMKKVTSTSCLKLQH